MPGSKYQEIREILAASLRDAERQWLLGPSPVVRQDVAEEIARVFASKTQAYREALLGAILAKMQRGDIDVRLPYAKHGDKAYNGRDIDEKIVNPFLHEKQIPCSRGPYLSVFRRSVRFDEGTRSGLRDKAGYNAFLAIVALLERAGDEDLRDLLGVMVFEFVRLRENAEVVLSRLKRTSLEQCEMLVRALLDTPSGGRFPVLLVASTFVAIRETYELPWTIECQGINVADSASGAGGDITIRDGERVLLAAEVTERPVDRSRVVATFNTKISPQGIEDYLFFVRREDHPPEVLRQARQYFSQGHEVNFVQVSNWMVQVLATLGIRGRTIFCRELAERLDEQETPKSLKLAWNDQIARITTSVT
jgi:hypothetical protein